MISDLTQQKVITVLPVGMDSRKLSVFRMAFRMHSAHVYQLVDDVQNTEPQLAIIDVDSMDGWEAWENFRQNYPQLPALIVTTTPPVQAPAPVLKKPVRVETLFPQMRELLLKPVTIAQPPQKPLVAPAPQKIEQPRHLTDVVTNETKEAVTPRVTIAPTPPVVAKETVVQKPAVSTAVEPPTHPATITLERFDPHAGLFGLITRLYRQKTAALIGIDGKPLIFIVPALEKALLLQPLEALQPLCENTTASFYHQELKPDDVLPADASEMRLQSLIWQLAIWTSRGRLPRGIGADTPIRLRFWPNLTRLPAIPDAMRITAFLTKTPVNLKIITRMLKVEPTHLFTYLTAAYGIGILDLPTRSATLSVISSQPVRPARPASPEPAIPLPVHQPRGGMLSRLLKKVIGL
ncbi:MAG TPA: hypothetical protein VJ642_09400 [Chromobacteriaceae bacterium]|nr:hypothetical protein [Chromobacteriaceae bacterium]